LGSLDQSVIPTKRKTDQLCNVEAFMDAKLDPKLFISAVALAGEFWSYSIYEIVASE
jgi:hypothetical protein